MYFNAVYFTSRLQCIITFSEEKTELTSVSYNSLSIIMGEGVEIHKNHIFFQRLILTIYDTLKAA